MLDGNSAPILVKGYRKHDNVRKTNIMVTIVISELLKTMFGPKGMNKMLISEQGEALITKSGKAVLERLKISNPIAKILIDAAITHERIVGDGTKFAVILTGELLKESWKLLNEGIHPTLIIEGFRKATDIALEVLDKLVINVSNDIILENVAKTVIGGTVDEQAGVHVTNLIVKSVKWITKNANGTYIGGEDVGVIKKVGGGINDSRLFNGIIIERGRPHPEMPEKVINPKIILLNCSLQPFLRKSNDWIREYVIREKEQLAAFIEKEDEINEDIVKGIKSTMVNVVFCSKRISKSLINCFAKEGILAFELISEKDLIKLAKATGGKIVSCVGDITKNDLGIARLVEFQKIAGEELFLLECCKDKAIPTLLLRGGTAQVIDELERVVKSGIKAVLIATKSNKILPGGGATEMEISRVLKEKSRYFKGREQLVIDAFAAAIESIPRIIATNAGLNIHEILTNLRAGHANGHTSLGINAVKRVICNVVDEGVLDVFDVKRHAIKVAYETATAILRIDDAIAVNLKMTKEAEKLKFKERKRVWDERIRRVYEKDEELKRIGKKLTFPSELV